MPAPAAPTGAPVPLRTPAAPATTYKTYSSYSPSPSEISYHRTFYSKIRRWTNDVRPQSTTFRGRSAVWSVADVREEASEDVRRTREDSPTPSNPYPRVRSSGGRAADPVHPEVAMFVDNRSNGRRPPDTSLAAVQPSPAIASPKYRSNPTLHPSRPNSHESFQSSLPSRRHLRDAYLAEALATPDLEVMSPVVAQRKQNLGKSVHSLPSASKAVELEPSRPLCASQDVAKPAGRESRTGAGSAALQSPLARSRIKTTAVHLASDVNSPCPIRSTPVRGRSGKHSAGSLSRPEAHNIPLPLSTVSRPNTNQPSRGPHPPSTFGLATGRPLPPSTADKPNSTLQSHAATVRLLPSASSPDSSRLLPVPANRGGEPRPAASIPVVSHHPSSLGPVLKTHPSISSLYPGSALGRPLGMKHRDLSTGNLQAHFEPAVYPLPPSASTVTTGLSLEREVKSNRQDAAVISIQPQPVYARPIVKQASIRLTKEEQRSKHLPTKPLPAPHGSQGLPLEDHYSFEVPQGDHHRLHVSLAWLKNDLAPSTIRVSDDEWEGPPVPPKSPPAGQSIPNNMQWPQPYPRIYPQPMSLDPHYRRGTRPLSPPAPFLLPLRRDTPYPESEGSLASEPSVALPSEALAFATGFIPRQAKDAREDHATEGGHWDKSVVREEIVHRTTQGYQRKETATAGGALEGPRQPLWSRLKASLTRPLARTNGLPCAPLFDPGQPHQDQVDWRRARIGATRVDRLEASERENRLRAERDDHRQRAADWRRRERRARRAEDKARRADERRARRKEREDRIAIDTYRMGRRRLTERFQQADRMPGSRKVKAPSNEKQKIAKIPWRERLQSSRKPASYYKPRATPLQAMNSAPAHHYDTEAAENHVNRWRQAQSKLATGRRINNARGEVISRFAWLPF